MSRPTLTYLINKIDYGGAEVGMVRLLSGLEPDDFDVKAVTLKEADPDLGRNLPDHVDVHQLGLDGGPTLEKLRRLRRHVNDADVLVCSLYPSIVVGSILGALSDVPQVFVWRHNTTDVGWTRKYVNRLSIRFADGVFTDSEATKSLVLDWGVEDDDVTVLPLAGIDVEEFPTVNHADASSDVRIGTVGRLVEQKGYPELLECASCLPEFEFHVVGDGPLAAELEGAPENVVTHGRVDDEELERLWSSFDIYFQPSRYEGLCITAIEAMACRLPVVASAVNGLTESVVDGETGYLVEQGDIEAYCRRLEDLATDPRKRGTFGAAGQDRVRKRYSEAALADSFKAAIDERGGR